MALSARAAVQPAADSSGYSEHLLIWSWRRIVSGRMRCPVMAQEFTEACGQNADRVFDSLCSFLKVLGFASRRRLAFCAPDPFGVTSDERQILTLLAAAQKEDHDLFQAHLRWLTQSERRHQLEMAACALAAALKANNLPLAVPQPATLNSCERPHAVT